MGAEWELIVLSGLAERGGVEYEAASTGSRKVDVQYRSADGLRIAADITAISDDGYEDDRRLQGFDDRLHAEWLRLRDGGIRGAFDVSVGTNASSSPRPVLPQQQELSKYISNRHFRAFKDKIAAEPTNKHCFVAQNSHANVRITFKPGARTSSGSYPDYKRVMKADENPAFRALRTKARHLRTAGVPSGYLHGIIICDGGSSLMHTVIRNPEPMQSICRRFFSLNYSVDFVCAVAVDDRRAPFRFCPRMFVRNPKDNFMVLTELFDTIFRSRPAPIMAPMNVYHRLNNKVEPDKRYRDTYNRGYSMTSDNEILFSSRALLDYVAGTLTREQFLGLVHPDSIEMIRRLLAEGNVLSALSLRRNESIDDDLVCLKFAPDVAVCEFTTPSER